MEDRVDAVEKTLKKLQKDKKEAEKSAYINPELGEPRGRRATTCSSARRRRTTCRSTPRRSPSTRRR